MSDTTPTPNAAPTPAKPGDKQLYAKNVQHDFIWKLRLTHPDRAELRLEWKGRPIVIDPVEVLPGDLVLLTSASPDRIRGTAAAVVKGDRPDVIADPAVLEWLKRQGPLGAESASEGVVAGVRFRSMPYTPVPEARPASYFLKASIGALRPRATLGGIRERASLPEAQPRAWELTLPEVGRLLHLDLALHRQTPAAWVDAMQDFYGADWVIVGCAWGENDGVYQHVAAFKPKQLLVTELVNGERRARGLPCEGVTLLRDRLHEAGESAHVFATQASYRFE